MKYMGSKRVMLLNGLGELIRRNSERSHRIIDLFSGSASVAWFAAQQTGKPVWAFDIQEYAVVLAASVIERTKPIEASALARKWIDKARSALVRSPVWKRARRLDEGELSTRSWVARARELCGKEQGGPVWRAYGGYYFCPSQALVFDRLLRWLPESRSTRLACLAALIASASECAASPGHTAQPFRPTRTAGPYLREAWKRDPISHVKKNLYELCSKSSLMVGRAKVDDAVVAAKSLNEHDLVFVDPPYSGVHYSRFYHVLETIARGSCGAVEGSGRYPPPEERPVSAFSQRSNSVDALQNLLEILADRGCSVILTFPNAGCSNGLSGDIVQSMAEELFRIDIKFLKTTFSTLGGNGTNRSTRHQESELILLLKAR